MKIVRYLNDEGKAQFGAQQEDDSVTRIEGCIFSDHQDTGETANVSKLLAPVKPAAVLYIGLNYRKHAEEGGADVLVVGEGGEEAKCIGMRTAITRKDDGPILDPTSFQLPRERLHAC